MYLQRIVLLFLSFAAPLAQAEMYSWRDANGKIHYGDKPPATQSAGARQLTAPPLPDDPQGARKAFLERQRLERERQQAEEDKKKAEAEKTAPPSPATPPPAK